MITWISVTETGKAPRGLQRAFNGANKIAHHFACTQWAAKFTDLRFTPGHARKAGYTKRRGEGLARDSDAFRRSYYGRKYYSEYGGGVRKADPLVYSGTTRERAKNPTVRATGKMGAITYPVNALNFRPKGGRIRMQDEFSLVLDPERDAYERIHETALNAQLENLRQTHETKIR